MKLPLPFRGQSVDYSPLTATENKVRFGKRFIGKSSSDIKTGEVPVNAPVNHKMLINDTYMFPVGIVDDESVFSQNIETMSGQKVKPGVGQVVIECAGKYMTDDIVVYAVENLVPEMIKFGEVVGEGEGAVTGTFQGFVD